MDQIFGFRPRTGLPRRSALALSALLLAVCLGWGTAPVASAAVIEGPVFNKPTGTAAEQYAIRDRLLAYIGSAAPQSDVKVAMYHLWDEGVAQALADAHTERQVNVQVMLDSTSAAATTDSSYAILRAALGTDRSQQSFVGTCPTGRSCLGDPDALSSAGINHNKFWLFSQVDGASDLVVQSSSNMTPSAYTRMWNDAYVMPYNVSMYTAYANYFEKLTKMDWANWKYTSVTASPFKAYFFPYPGSGNSKDTIWNILDGVTCTYKSGTATLKTKVRVAVLKLTRQGVAEKLTALQKAGCAVEVVYAETDSLAGSGTAGTWEALHASGGPSVRCYNHDEDGDPDTTNSVVHSKYLLIDGMYSGAVNKVLWTGSHNYSGPALRENDEALLKVDSSTAHDAYVATFNSLKSAAIPGTADTTDECKGVKHTED
ncbi:phospholipase D-like domain-containing protein [Streptomyces sp. NPDC008163]|uniref:phospholipase D-like domain-containing protein n=1 Tax=Streptomyces sp. NPDC008163 TaxID=3364818 RepID=UPI0036EFF43C